LPVTFYVAYSC